MRSSTLALVAAATAVSAAPRYVMYFDQYVQKSHKPMYHDSVHPLANKISFRWHNKTLPSKEVTAGVNYVITAFAPAATFNTGTSYQPFTPLDKVRALFDQGTKVCMAIGGWGETAGFSTAAATADTRKTYAKNVATTLTNLGYDCVGKSHADTPM